MKKYESCNFDGAVITDGGLRYFEPELKEKILGCMTVDNDCPCIKSSGNYHTFQVSGELYELPCSFNVTVIIHPNVIEVVDAIIVTDDGEEIVDLEDMVKYIKGGYKE